MNKPLCYGGGLFAGLLILGGVAAAQDWYVSNAAGMALEPAFSRFALRNEYALSVDARSLADIPEPLRAYYTGPYHIELRTLYEKGEESKRQWIFRDDRRVDRLAAAFNEDGSGFIELYDAGGFLSEEHRIDAGGDEYIVTYHYNRDLLVRAETRLKAPPRAAETEAESPAETAAEPEDAGEAGTETAAEPGGAGEAGTETAAEPEDAGEAGTETAAAPDPPGETEAETVVTELWTDYYRYSRSYSLRAVDRVFHQDVPAVRTRFPHQVLAAASAEDDFVRPGSAHGSGFLGDVLMKSGDRIVYTTDERGRVLREVRRDEEGNILGEMTNTWDGDRLSSVRWVSGEDERVSEYEYDGEGDRIIERNYHQGVLERVVRREGDREVEELYMNGTVILRAFWGKDGRKISEERVRPGSGEGAE